MELINIERAKAGVKPLIMCEKLVEVAKTKATEQASSGVLSHESPNYGRVGEMLCVFGIDWSYCGENLAAGQSSPEAVVKAWMNSPSHKANILSENFALTGIALTKNAKGRIFWVQLFSRP